MVETGETLKSTRELSGVSLDEVSRDLGIPVLFLEQIEDGSIGSFEDIYELKKMILDYAKYLGLNTETIVNKFNEYMFEYTSKIPMDEYRKKQFVIKCVNMMMKIVLLLLILEHIQKKRHYHIF